MLVWSLPHKSKKQLDNDVDLCPKSVHHYPTVILLLSGLVHVVTDADCQTLNCSAHGYDFWTSNFNCFKKLDHKLILKNTTAVKL